MDPLSLIGGIASAGAIIGGITKTVQGLCTLRGKFSEADLTLGAIISELSVVKAALYQIQDWLDCNKDGMIQEELEQALDVALNGCRECIDILADDVTSMVGDTLQYGSKMLMRTRTIWNEAMMKEHQSRLHHQVCALQLLLQAVQVRTLAGQAAILRQPKARQLIQQVKDDTSSIRATIRASKPDYVPYGGLDMSQRDSITLRTCAESTISGPCLPNLDRQILSSTVYQNHGAAAIAKHDENGHSHSKMDEVPEHMPKSPTSTTSSERRQRPQPRIITANLSPPQPKPVTQAQLSPTPLTPESMPRTPTQYSPMTPVTAGGSMNRSPLHQSSPRWPITSTSYAYQQQTKSSSDGRLGLRARLRSNFSRASLSPKSPLSASPTSPGSSLPRAQRKLRCHGNERSVDICDGDVGVDPMIKAAQLGSSWDIEHLLMQGSGVNTRHIPTGRTPLAIAAHCGHIHACNLLLDHGAAIEAVDYNDQTPLHLAVEHEHLEVAALLLQHGAKTQSRDQAQNTPLHEVALIGDNDMAKLLLEHGADPLANNLEHQTPLHVAACKGNLEVADLLTAKQRHVNVKGRNGMSPLMQAAAAGRSAMVGLLLRKKASLKFTCAAGWQPLHYAASNGHADIVDLLLSQKSPIDARTKDGRTPLMLSARSSFSVTDLLLRKGSQLHKKCSSAKQALHYACEANNIPIIRLLLQFGASVESEGALQCHPMHIAASVGSVEQLQLFVQYGADIEIRNAAGDRPLCIAAATGHVEMVEALLDNGTAVNRGFSNTSSQQDSPLGIACKHGNLDVAAILITRGASVNERDAQGWRPIRHAIYNAWPDVVEMLLARGASDTATDHAYSAFTSFATFAPGIATDDPRVARIKTLLQLSKSRERAQPDTACMGELEGNGNISPGTGSHTHAYDLPAIGGTRALQRLDIQPEVNSGSGISATLFTSRPVPVTETHLTATSGISPITDSTYHIQWPWPHNNLGKTYHRITAAEGQRGLSSMNSAISPLSGGTIPSVLKRGNPISPMTIQEQEQLRRLRCVACTGMGRDLPDSECTRCRQNVFTMKGGQTRALVAVAGAEDGGSPAAAVYGSSCGGDVFEMDATGRQA